MNEVIRFYTEEFSKKVKMFGCISNRWNLLKMKSLKGKKKFISVFSEEYFKK